jgi:uncharacterized membrane protein
MVSMRRVGTLPGALVRAALQSVGTMYLDFGKLFFTMSLVMMNIVRFRKRACLELNHLTPLISRC